MIKRALIFVLFILSVSLCFASGKQTIDQVTENKIRIENIEEQQEKLSDRVDEKSEKQKEYTDKEINEKINNLLNDRSDVLSMREKWIDKFLMYLSIFMGIIAIGLPIFIYFANKRLSEKIEKQTNEAIEYSKEKVRRIDDYADLAIKTLDVNLKHIEEIVIEAENEQYNAKEESKLLQRYLRRRRKDIDNLFDELENKKLELDVFVEKSKVVMYELSKDSLVKDKKINPKLYAIIEDILEEKEESNYDTNDWKIKGNKFVIKKDYSKAIYFYTKAIELNLNDSDGYINRGVAYLRNKKYDEALNDFKRAIEISPNSHLAYYNLGIVKVHIKKYSEAFKAYMRAISLKPRYSDVYMNLLELAIIDNKKSIWEEYSESVSKIHLSYDNMGLLSLLKSIAKIYFFDKKINIDIVKSEIDKLFKKCQNEIDWSFKDLAEWINKTNFKRISNKEKVENLIIFVKEIIEKHNSSINKK